jgi:alpha-L-fucosidase
MRRFTHALPAVLCLILFCGMSSARAQDGWWHPLRPPGIVPTPEQAAWEDLEFGLFIHIGVNTWADKEVTFGEIPASVFNPDQLDARQWVRVAKAAGMKYVILYVKHIDGFCLWPTSATDYSVKSSPWRNGKGDLVKEVADACRAEGMKFGVALCLIGSHEPAWVDRDDVAYDQYLQTLVRELLTNYGDILTVWYDPGWTADGRLIYCDHLYTLVKRLQPKTLVAMGGIYDTGWGGNELGTAPETVHDLLTVAGYPYWTPLEADASTRTYNWFWDPDKDDTVLSVPQLLDMFNQSMGHGTNLLLNIPPDRHGLFPEKDAQNVIAAGRIWMQNFNRYRNLALNRPIVASSSLDYLDFEKKLYNPGNAVDGDPDTYWMARDDAPQDVTLEVDLGEMKRYNRVMLQEMITRGQRVESFRLENWDGSAWATICDGTTVGHRKVVVLPDTVGSKVRLTLHRSFNDSPPTLREFGVYQWRDDPGDVNGDGMIRTDDDVSILRRSIGLAAFTPDQDASADVNMDGKVTVQDAILLLNQIVGKTLY